MATNSKNFPTVSGPKTQIFTYTAPWAYLINICRSLVCSKLGSINTGHLVIEETGLAVRQYGTKKNGSVVKMKVLKESFWPRVLIYGAMVILPQITWNDD
jgi:hypothetical protein